MSICLVMAALRGEPVTQAHTDYCAAHGHAAHTVDGVASETCPRCGEVTEPACQHPECKGPGCGWDKLSAAVAAAPVETTPAHGVARVTQSLNRPAHLRARTRCHCGEVFYGPRPIESLDAWTTHFLRVTA